LAEHGIDWTTDLVPVAPAQHYHSGGVVTDLRGRTNVPGLYAGGEVACTGVHGANRLASNSLLEGRVFAPGPAPAVAAGLGSGRLAPCEPVGVEGPVALVPAAMRSRVQRAAAYGPGVVRSREGLLESLDRLAAVPIDGGPRPAGVVDARPQV